MVGVIDPYDIDLPTLAWLAGSSANRAVLAELHELGHEGVRQSHGYVVQHLIAGTPTVGELAEALGVTQQAASKHLLELERLGYVAREPDPADNRVRRAVLTEHGRRLVEDSRRIRARLNEQLQASRAAKEALVRLLDLTGGTDAVRHRRVGLPGD